MKAPSLRRACVLGLLLVIGEPRVPFADSPPEVHTSELNRVQSIALTSDVLGEERTLLVRTPREYADGTQSYPVLVVLDADWHFSLVAADVEFLSECSYLSSHPVPELIVVGITNVDRNRDFTPTCAPDQIGMSFPTSGGADRFRRFLVEEVLPFVDATYRTRPFRILAGWSLGGLFTVDMLLGASPAFDVYLAISPSLWWDDDLILRRVEAGDAGRSLSGPRQLVLTLGTREQSGDTHVARSTMAFQEHLESSPLANVSVELVPIEGFGHNYAPKLAFFYGLATIFDDLTLPADVLAEGLPAIDSYYATLSDRYQYDIRVPEDAYGMLGWQLFEEERMTEAETVFELWVARHPGSALAVASLGSFRRETGQADEAIALLERAIRLEEASASPRSNFIHDLRRDVATLRLAP